MKLNPGIASIGLMCVMGIVLVGCSGADEPVQAAEPATQPAPTTQAAAYPLDTCVVSGEKLGSMGDPVIFMHEGREVRFCCSNCEAEFKKEPAKYMSMVDEAYKNAGKPATQPQ